ncbi:MAG: 4-hydroxy-tetrahydrodipicolinate reductase [Candidatus Levybacteria bacterium]|nr:4-hydroxy-tetrahydrodipicolinate reductase [Candidatus Levybacteria bacterium]
MKIALIGYGNMGQEVEKLINESNSNQIVSISCKNITDKLDLKGIKKADVAIDFTSADIILKTVEQVAGLGKNIVVGTTGWYKDLDKVEKIIKKSKTGLIYGQNFSIGANVFFKIAEKACQMFSKYDDYDVYGLEIHHTGKKDSPSGTAKKVADIIMKNFPKKKSLQTEKLDRKIENEELHFASVRGGFNPGYHEVVFDSMSDEIKIIHQARGRRGFAKGAIKAAEFIKGKKGLYSFDDLFKIK